MIYNEKKDTRQQESAYILYMILGSCFHKSFCRSHQLERQLLLYYKEMSRKEQENKEERIIKAVENFLGEKSGEFASFNCDVTLYRKDEDLFLAFDTGFEVLLARVNRSGLFILYLYEREAKTGEYKLSRVA